MSTKPEFKSPEPIKARPGRVPLSSSSPVARWGAEAEKAPGACGPVSLTDTVVNQSLPLKLEGEGWQQGCPLTSTHTVAYTHISQTRKHTHIPIAYTYISHIHTSIAYTHITYISHMHITHRNIMQHTCIHITHRNTLILHIGISHTHMSHAYTFIRTYTYIPIIHMHITHAYHTCTYTLCTHTYHTHLHTCISHTCTSHIYTYMPHAYTHKHTCISHTHKDFKTDNGGLSRWWDFQSESAKLYTQNPWLMLYLFLFGAKGDAGWWCEHTIGVNWSPAFVGQAGGAQEQSAQTENMSQLPCSEHTAAVWKLDLHCPFKRQGASCPLLSISAD